VEDIYNLAGLCLAGLLVLLTFSFWHFRVGRVVGIDVVGFQDKADDRREFSRTVLVL
jgi:hypothetical protein